MPPSARPAPPDQRSQRSTGSAWGGSSARDRPDPAASAPKGTMAAATRRQGKGRLSPASGGSSDSSTLADLGRRRLLREKGRLEVVDRLDAHVLEPLVL